ncbi:MAG: hypothetical protein ACKVX7_18840 [Planctomycetota bacterium]
MALLTKETAYPWPLLALCAATLRLGGTSTREAQRRVRVLCALSMAQVLALCAWRFSQGSLGGYASPLGIFDRCASFAIVYLEYLWQTVSTSPLFIGDTALRFSALTPSEQAGGLTAAIALMSAHAYVFVRYPRLRVAWLAFAFALLPVAQIVPIPHFRADRFLYLPLLPLMWIGVSTFERHMRPEESTLRRYASIAVGLALVVGFAARIELRLPAFRDDRTLFSRELLTQPEYKEGLSFLALAAQRAGDLPQAAAYYRRCMRPDPRHVSYVDSSQLHVNFTSLLLKMRRSQEAYDAARSGLAQPIRAEVLPHLKYNLGVAAYQLERFPEAVELFCEYRAVDPSDVHNLYLLGYSAMRSAKFPLAQEAFESYLRICKDAPDRTEVLEWLAAIRRLPK